MHPQKDRRPGNPPVKKAERGSDVEGVLHHYRKVSQGGGLLFKADAVAQCSAFDRNAAIFRGLHKIAQAGWIKEGTSIMLCVEKLRKQAWN